MRKASSVPRNCIWIGKLAKEKENVIFSDVVKDKEDYLLVLQNIKETVCSVQELEKLLLVFLPTKVGIFFAFMAV